MKSKTKKLLALLCAVVMVATTFFGNWYTKPVEVQAADSVEPISLEGYENVTIKDFSKNGAQMPETTYTDPTAGGGTLTTYSLTNGQSLDKTLVSMKVKFIGGGGNARLDIAGSGDWTGFSFWASNTNHYLHAGTNYGAATGVTGTDFDISKAGYTKAIDEEMLLQMAFTFEDTTLTVDVYVDGVLCGTSKFTGLNSAKIGNCLGIYIEGSDKSMELSSVKWPAEPVQLDGFENVTIKNFNGLVPGKVYEGVTTGMHNDGTAMNVTDFDNALLSMKVTLTGGSYRTRLDIAGNGAWQGFSLQANSDGSTLNFSNNYGMTTTTDLPSMTASVAEVSSFLNNEFLLQLSFEYGEVVNNRTDLTLGVYIEGKLYNNEKFTIADCDVTKLGNHLAVYSEAVGGNIILDNVILPVTPVQQEGFTNLTLGNFVSSSDNSTVMKAGIYPGSSTGAHSDYYVKGLSNFDDAMVSLNVKFEGGSYMNSIIIGGNGGWAGFNIHPNDNNGSSLVIDKSWGGNSTTSSSQSLSATTAGLTSFVNNEFLLQVSFEYGEVVDNKADLTMKIYIDGKLYNDQSFTFASCDMSTVGTHMALYRQVDGVDMTVGAVEFDEFYGYDMVNLGDFDGLEAKAYDYYGSADLLETFYATGYENFDKKVVSMRVKYKYGTDNTRIDLGGVGDWSGLMIYPNAQGTYLFVVCSNAYGMSDSFQALEVSAATAGIDTFIDNEFLLQVSFDYGETDVEVGVYINGKLYNNQKKTFTGCKLNKFGNSIGLYRQHKDSVITVAPNDDSAFPSDPLMKPNPDFTKLTFGHFGIIDGKYPYVSGNVAVYGSVSDRTTLDKTVITGSIFLEGSNSSQIIWGGTSDWDGLRMFPSTNGMSLTWYKGNTATAVGTLSSDIAGVKFVGEQYDIMLSTELVDNGGDGNVNDIKIGIWINGVLYNQQYFYATDLGDNLGNCFSVYCASATDAVTLGSQRDLLEQPSEGLKKVTFKQFGIEDGTYESATDINVKGTYAGGSSVAGVVLCGDVQLHNSNAGEIDIFLGSNTNVWEQGIRLTKYGDAADLKLIYQTSSSYKVVLSIQPSVAGIDLDEQFNLMWSMELVDSDTDGSADDLKVGLWFNGFLYKNAYVYIQDFGTDNVGNVFATYCASGTSITLNSIYELTDLPDKSFDRITFSDFGLESQEITCGPDVVASSKASAYDVLDRVVFSGDFRFADDGAYQIIYGGDAAWGGLRFMIESDGSMNVSWFKGNESQMVVWTTPEFAKVDSFTKNTFNLMVSTELVDDDGDGNKNDIKIGVWFDEVLYYYNGEGYHIVKDWGDQLKNGFSIYGVKGADTSVMIRNVDSYQKNPYYYDEIAEYREGTKTAPEAPVGKVFAGWFEDPEYTTAIEQDATSGNAWAKFVEEDVLSAKPQVQLNADGSIPTDKTNLRFVTTVDDLDYRRISFYIEKEGGKGVQDAATMDENPRLVYEKLYYISDNTKVMSYEPTVFSWQSEYFKAFTVEGIPANAYETTWTVTPYWITMDGTIVKGKVLETKVSDYGKNTSKAVSIDYLGKDTMPITGYNGPYVVQDANDAMLFPDYITDEYFKMIADSGVNVIISNNLDYNAAPDKVLKALRLGEKYGIGMYVQDSAVLAMTQKADVEARIAAYKDYDSFAGMYVVDEPGTDDYNSNDRNVDKYATISGILNELGILTYVNAYPIVDTTTFWDSLFGASDEENYSNYIAEINSTLDPAVLMWDFYPFVEDQSKMDLEWYFFNMAEVREQAQADNKPFWAYVQAGGNWNDDKNYFNTSNYYPDEGEFNWDMNTALAFGAQGIQYFPLIQPYHFAYAGSSADDKVWDFERNGLIGAFGNKTQWYDYAEAANAHVGAIDHILMNSYSEQVIALGSAQNDTKDLNDVVTSASYKELTSVSENANALIGCFDYKGKTALYVVNYDYDNAGTVTLNFNGSKNITKIENAVESTTSGSSITLSMTAGEGILLVIE